MMLSYTSDEKTLLRYDHQRVDVFDLETCKIRFGCEGQIIGLSHGHTLMIVKLKSGYSVYHLHNGTSNTLTALSSEMFPAHQRLDSHAGLGMADVGMPMFDVFTRQTVFTLKIPAEKGVSLGFTRSPLTRFLDDFYGVALVWYDTDWGEGREIHVFDLNNGQHVLKSHLPQHMSFHVAYEPRQKMLIQHVDYGSHHRLISLETRKTLGTLEPTETLVDLNVRPIRTDFKSRFTEKLVGSDEYKTIAVHPHLPLTAALADTNYVYIIRVDMEALRNSPHHSLSEALAFHILKTIPYTRISAGNADVDSMIYHPDGERLIMSYSGGHVEMLDVTL